ncbi:hypothetical protein RJT34_11866 [Clitoria ternatea]|uniref:Transcription repressor n=1 Tax=Clitoria ternatea TaxID=43366 RepID=A0AAN9PJX8_CLITE
MEPTKRHREKKAQRRKNRISFSARLPNDVSDAFADSLCAVMYSANPFVDIQLSILEMIVTVGIHDWDEIEELVYCFVALNSSELHHSYSFASCRLILVMLVDTCAVAAFG